MSRVALILSLAAALLFAVGGVFMKMSNGLERLVPGSAALGLFLAGAVAQTIALKHAELGVAYVLVLGLEAVLAFVFGALFFEENVSLPKVLGVALIIGGFALLNAGASAGAR
jgi:multidrug transporter EmrE-like cation transporter